MFPYVYRLTFLFIITAAISPIAEAGYTEYTLLNFTECTGLLISTDLPLTYEQSKAAQGAAKRRYLEMIEKMSKTHDESWSEGLNIIDKDSNIYFGFCKGDFDQTKTRAGGLYCDGEEVYPLPELRCKAGTGNRWYSKCSVKGKKNHDIRLYWVDTGEYEDGGPENPNLGYERDKERMKAQCAHSIGNSNVK